MDRYGGIYACAFLDAVDCVVTTTTVTRSSLGEGIFRIVL